MEQEISIHIFYLVLTLFIVNTILEHLLNWAFRITSNEEMFLPAFGYAFKTIIFLGILWHILH